MNLSSLTPREIAFFVVDHLLAGVVDMYLPVGLSSDVEQVAVRAMLVGFGSSVSSWPQLIPLQLSWYLCSILHFLIAWLDPPHL